MDLNTDVARSCMANSLLPPLAIMHAMSNARTVGREHRVVDCFSPADIGGMTGWDRLYFSEGCVEQLYAMKGDQEIATQTTELWRVCPVSGALGTEEPYLTGLAGAVTCRQRSADPQGI